jgi:superfamily II DNA or RNA helicase
MEIDNIPEQPSRFQLYQPIVQGFLEKERAADPDNKKTKLHDHQIDAVLAAKEHFDDPEKNKEIGLIQVPTGGGKSGII